MLRISVSDKSVPLCWEVGVMHQVHLGRVGVETEHQSTLSVVLLYKMRHQLVSISILICVVRKVPVSGREVRTVNPMLERDAFSHPTFR